MAFTTGFAQLVVSPSFKGFHKKSERMVSQETRTTGTAAGRRIGQNLMGGAAAGAAADAGQLRRVADQVAASVQTAAAAVTKAQGSYETANRAVRTSSDAAAAATARQANAAGQLRVAQSRLVDITAQYGAGSTQVLAAQERVAAAQRAVATTTLATGRAQDAHTAAMSRATAAQGSLTAAQQKHTATQAAAKNAMAAANAAAMREATVGQAGAHFARTAAAQITAGGAAIRAAAVAPFSDPAVALGLRSRAAVMYGSAGTAAAAAFTAAARTGQAGAAFMGAIGRQVSAGAGAVRAAVGGALASSAAAGAAAGATVGASFMGGMLRAAAPLAALFGAGAVIGKGFGRLADIEQAEAKLTGLGHSAATVQTAMDSALASVKGTAFGLGEAASAGAGLIAAGIEPGLELERVLGLVGDAAHIGGVSFTEMGAIFNKVAAGNKIQAEEMNQLMDRGIPIQQLLAESMGTSVEGVRELSAAGAIGFAEFADAMEAGMGGAALSAGETMKGTWANVGAAISRMSAAMLEPLWEPLRQLGQGIITVIDTMIMPALNGLFTFVQANAEWLAPLAQAVAVGVGVALAFGLMGKAVLGVAWAFGFLKTVLLAHPIILTIALVAAGIALLWQHSETFRAVVVSVWGQVSAAVSQAWTGWIQPALAAFGGFLRDVVGPAVMAFWSAYVQPAFAAIGGFIAQVWTTGIYPNLQALWRFLATVVGPAVMTLWTGYVQPAFAAIGSFIAWAWASVIAPALQGMWGFITNVLAPVFGWLWNSMVKPAIDAIVFLFRILVNVVRLEIDIMVSLFRNVLAPVFMWLWHNVVNPVFNWIADKFNALTPVVRSIVGAIAKEWKSLEGSFAAPINWVIKWVYNKGIKALFDSAAEAVGSGARLPAAGYIGGQSASNAGSRMTPSAYAKGGLARKGWALVGEEGPELVNFTNPGRVYTADQTRERLGVDWPGGPSGDNAGGSVLGDVWDTLKGVASDVWGVLTDPLAAMQTLVRKTVGAMPFSGTVAQVAGDTVTHLAKTVGSGLLEAIGFGAGDFGGGPAGGASLGGQGWRRQVAILHSKFPAARVTSTYRPGAVTAGYGTPSNHGRGRAIDIGGYQEMDVFNWLYSTYGRNSLELLYSHPAAMGRNIYKGRNFRPNAVTVRNHRNHIHWAYDSGGWMMPGTGGYYNGTGKPEPVLTTNQWDTASKAMRVAMAAPSFPSQVTLVDRDGSLLGRMDVRISERLDMEASWQR